MKGSAECHCHRDLGCVLQVSNLHREARTAHRQSCQEGPVKVVERKKEEYKRSESSAD